MNLFLLRFLPILAAYIIGVCVCVFLIVLSMLTNNSSNIHYMNNIPRKMCPQITQNTKLHTFPPHTFNVCAQCAMWMFSFFVSLICNFWIANFCPKRSRFAPKHHFFCFTFWCYVFFSCVFLFFVSSLLVFLSSFNTLIHFAFFAHIFYKHTHAYFYYVQNVVPSTLSNNKNSTHFCGLLGGYVCS